MAMTPQTNVRTSGSLDSLRHLERVGLEVERLPHALQEGGLTQQDLSGVVREHLGRAPGQILTRTGALHLKGAPTLTLSLSVSEEKPGVFVYSVVLELVQGVRFERLNDSSRSVAAPTWRAEATGLVEQGQFALLKDQAAAVAQAFAVASGEADKSGKS